MRNSERYSRIQNEIGSRDTFAQISQIVINYDNQARILSEAVQFRYIKHVLRMVYKIHIKNSLER